MHLHAAHSHGGLNDRDNQELYRLKKEDDDHEGIKVRGMKVGNEVVLGTTKTK